jgi:molecular chaperone DnaK
MIPRNTTIPARSRRPSPPRPDNQTQVEVHVLQGERPMARDNKTLGRFQLDGIPPAPRGVPQVEVTFDIDANGILNVTARDKATGVEKQIRIEASSGLSEADIKRAVDDAAAHESEDKARKETIEARNKLDTLIYSTRKLVTDSGSKIGDADKLMIEEALKDADRVLEANRDATTPDDLRRVRGQGLARRRAGRAAGADASAASCFRRRTPGCARARALAQSARDVEPEPVDRAGALRRRARAR